MERIKFSAFLGKSKYLLYILPPAIALELFFTLFIPGVMANVIDQGVLQLNPAYIGQTALSLLAASVAELLTALLTSFITAYGCSILISNLRRYLFQHILQISLADFEKIQSSSLLTRLTGDLLTIQFSLMLTWKSAFRLPILIILAWFLTWRINYKIAMMYILLMFVLSPILGLIAYKAYRYFKELFQKNDELNKCVRENITGIKVVKSYVREQAEIDKFQNIARIICNINIKAEKIANYFNPLMNAVVYLVVLFILYAGGKSLVFGEMKIGQITAVMLYTMQIIMAFFYLTFVLLMNIFAAAARKRIMEVMQIQPKILPSTAASTSLPDNSVKFEHVVFSYKQQNTATINNLDFFLPAGKSLAILGATGSGKSTSINLLLRFYDADGGTIKIGNRDIKTYDPDFLHAQIAVVLQNNFLFNGTIKENLQVGAAACTEKQMEQACALAACDFVFSYQDKFEHEIAKGAANLSGGQKQRLCLARAFIKKPAILILDDATSALDTVTETKIFRNLQEYLPDATKIVVTQRISAVEKCDFALIMQNGQMQDFNTPAELARHNAVYQEIMLSQGRKEAC